MRIITRRRLREFWEEHPDAEESLRIWERIMKTASYRTPADVKAQFRHASMVGRNVTVFNICGNKYRLVVSMRYDRKKVFIRHVVTHAQYDQLSASGLL
ncbi:MAG TPA: type II toxin-antitoxin system HigB family toxin [Longimicrobium sp.]|nr:type II toxin-antitoxin system HigB family toxin [Longimicrobium sp.]